MTKKETYTTEDLFTNSSTKFTIQESILIGSVGTVFQYLDYLSSIEHDPEGLPSESHKIAGGVQTLRRTLNPHYSTRESFDLNQEEGELYRSPYHYHLVKDQYMITSGLTGISVASAKSSSYRFKKAEDKKVKGVSIAQNQLLQEGKVDQKSISNYFILGSWAEYGVMVCPTDAMDEKYKKVYPCQD